MKVFYLDLYYHAYFLDIIFDNINFNNKIQDF